MSYNYTFFVIAAPNRFKYVLIAKDFATYFILIIYLSLCIQKHKYLFYEKNVLFVGEEDSAYFLNNNLSF